MGVGNQHLRIRELPGVEYITCPPDAGQCLTIDTSGIRVYDSDRYTKFALAANGYSLFYGDIVMASGSDIKLDGAYLVARLDQIEQRLTNGGL